MTLSALSDSPFDPLVAMEHPVRAVIANPGVRAGHARDVARVLGNARLRL